jgi:hypothetical protein
MLPWISLEAGSEAIDTKCRMRNDAGKAITRISCDGVVKIGSLTLTNVAKCVLLIDLAMLQLASTDSTFPIFV